MNSHGLSEEGPLLELCFKTFSLMLAAFRLFFFPLNPPLRSSSFVDFVFHVQTKPLFRFFERFRFFQASTASTSIVPKSPPVNVEFLSFIMVVFLDTMYP